MCKIDLAEDAPETAWGPGILLRQLTYGHVDFCTVVPALICRHCCPAHRCEGEQAAQKNNMPRPNKRVQMLAASQAIM